MNAPIEDQANGVTGFKGPDNLANGPDGKLWIVEDNAFSDIWVYDPRSKDANKDGYRDGVHLFASLKAALGPLARQKLGMKGPAVDVRPLTSVRDVSYDEFFAGRPEAPLCLPTGQCLVVKLP